MAMNNLRGAFPGQENESFKKSQAQQASSFQQQLGQAPVTQDVTGAAQAAGGQQAAQTAESAVGAQKQAQGTRNYLAGVGMQERARDIQGRVQDLAIEKDAQSIRLADRLGEINSEQRKNVFDAQLKIRKDSRNQAALTERQFLDYAIVSATNEQDFMDWAQRAQKVSQREIQMWDAVNKKLGQKLKQAYETEKTSLDQGAIVELTNMKRAAEAAMKKAAGRAKSRMAAWQTGGTIVGGVAGAVIGSVLLPGAGTAAGASIGSSVGGAAGSYVGSQTSE